MTQRFKKGCGRASCCSSTGICGGMTFGTGKLDPYGYWQYPCGACERAWVEQYGTIDTNSPEFLALVKADIQEHTIG